MTFLGNKENSENLYWGIKTWEASVGETRPRIFNLLGNNSVGRVFTQLGKSRAWIVCQSTGEVGEEGLEHSSSSMDMYFMVFGLHWGLGV